jgi:transcriptional regulator with XRE-family HTH domain
MLIGARIRKARLQAGLSQTDLARIAGVSRGLVGQWESHKKKPGRETLLRVAEATAVSVAYLLASAEGPKARIEISKPDEIALLQLYRRLTRAQQRNLRTLLASELQVPRAPRSEAEKSAPSKPPRKAAQPATRR